MSPTMWGRRDKYGLEDLGGSKITLYDVTVEDTCIVHFNNQQNVQYQK